MKKLNVLSIVTCFVALVFLTACSRSFQGYDKTDDGLYYKFHIQNKNTPNPKQTDFLRVGMACYLNDVLYYDWQENESVYSQLTPPVFPGDLQKAYSMMHLGDSASFYIKADSVAIHYYDKDPKEVGIKPDDYFRYEIKLLEIMPEEKFQANIERMKDKMIKESREELEGYITSNNITVTPLESGIYIVSKEKGSGRCPVKGDIVEVDFESRMLNGRLLASTFGKDEKFSFVLGSGYVIPGWEEIVPQMHLGERVTAVIPFEMAYGEHSVTGIPPYANLVYDIKLLKITTAEEIAKIKE